jgi:capsid protein
MKIRERIGRWLLGSGAAFHETAMTDAGGVRTRRFYGQRFDGGLPSPTPSLLLDSTQTRRQLRTLSHTSLQLRALLERDVDTVISNGLNIAPEPKHKILGIEPSAAKAWAADVKTRFELWAMDARSSRSSRHNFFQAQRLMRKSLHRDGELFLALSYHSDPTLLSPLRFQILDPDQIREAAFTWTGSGRSLNPQNQEGIIYNAEGEEIKYRVWKAGEGGIQTETIIPRVGRSGRVMMLHALTGEDYAGQLRGLSPLSVSAQDLENIINFVESEVNKGINQANIVFTVESETDEPAQDPFAIGGGLAAKVYGNNPTPPEGAQNVTPESLEPVYTNVPHTEVKHPGSVGVYSLPGRQKLKPFPSTAPAAAFNVFVDGLFAYIAASNGQSVETVLNRYNSNYSASRAAIITVWRKAVQLRWELDYYILGPVYEMWLSEEIAAGRISAPGWADPRLRSAWVSHRYNGISMPNIDPTRTAAAAKEYLSMGATTLEDVAIEYNDSDAEANRIKLKEELGELREIGPMPWAEGTQKDAAPDSAKREKDEKDKNGEEDES